MKALAAIAATLVCAAAYAHSSSDAYLTLDVPRNGDSIVIAGRWDIALRDLHFVLALDDDGDGAITWGEMRRHRADIESYAYARLRVAGEAAACTIERGRMLVAAHADGGYASLEFRIACPRGVRAPRLDYRLFFDVDPSHRGIVIVRNGGAVATSLASPGSRTIALAP